tara:strand:- start:977 stop:1858 length:882 start_codon:yes stop_codon:yes gene_type:complete
MMKVGFFGDGKWAYNSLKELLKNKSMSVKFIVLRKSNPDQNLIKLAKQKKLKFYIFKNVNNNFALNIIKKMKIDIIVSVSYDQIFKKKLIDYLKLGIINFHAGNLPFYRGRSPLNWAIINGEKFFGITVHYVNEGIDTGDIILQKKFLINDTDDFKSILIKVYKECPKILMQSLKLIKNNKIKRVKQNNLSKKGSYFRKRVPGDENIDWNKSSREIHCFIRGLCKPGVMARSFANNKEIRINKVYKKFKSSSKRILPGTIIKVFKSSFFVKTRNSSIRIKEWTGKVKEGLVLR